MHKILLDFEIQTDPTIPAKCPHLVLNHKMKSTSQLVHFAVQADLKVTRKKKRKKKEKNPKR